MAWQTDIISLVRVMINDLGDSPQYSDERLIQTITVAAKYLQFDVNLDHKYDVDLVNQTITPDPTDYGDDIFLCIAGLKTACIIDQSTFRSKAALEGIRAALGPAQLSVGGHMEGFKQILEHGPCKLYADLTEHWDVQNATAVAAILSPFVGNKFDPFMLPYDDHRHKNFYS
jgi:hypothetical protein